MKAGMGEVIKLNNSVNTPHSDQRIITLPTTSVLSTQEISKLFKEIDSLPIPIACLYLVKRFDTLSEYILITLSSHQ